MFILPLSNCPNRSLLNTWFRNGHVKRVGLLGGSWEETSALHRDTLALNGFEVVKITPRSHHYCF